MGGRIMGYFANGTEAMQWQEKNCLRCRNYKIREGEDTVGCPIWDLHFIYAYEVCDDEGTPAKVMLDTLIPITENGLYNKQCSMFERGQNGKRIVAKIKHKDFQSKGE